MKDGIFKTAPHTPAHLFQADAIYMITGATYQKESIIKTDARKTEWNESFIKASELYDWNIIARVVLDNHYHVIVKSPEQSARNLPKYVSSFHKFTARKWNEEEQLPGRKVWWNYWDTCVRSEKDFFNRLKYVFWNPVKHGLVEKAEEYPFSNYKEYLMQSQIFDFIGMDEVNDVAEF